MSPTQFGAWLDYALADTARMARLKAALLAAEGPGDSMVTQLEAFLENQALLGIHQTEIYMRLEALEAKNE